ncbi:MAG: hypothetical protein NPIRA01_38360 [Nitrospirales bacterium]|nr:MAG: hypothetical protein NPIRA01_38360 [Nitrospirales bacterium]
MLMNVTKRSMLLSLIGAVGFAILSGCNTGLTREAIGKPRVEHVIRERVPSGSPTLSLVPHDDELGWTISVTQPHTETRVIQEAQDWETKRYVLFPPSFVLGLIQCPIGLLFSTITFDMLGADARDYGCQRLLMREPVDGTIQTTTQRDTRKEVIESIEPLHGGEFVYGWPDASLPSIRANLDQHGQTSLRLSHVLGQMSQDELSNTIIQEDELVLEISQHGTKLVSQTLPMSHKALLTAKKQAMTPLPAERFPDRMVVTIKAADPAVKEALEDWVLRQGWCLAAGAARHAMIIDELREQYSGRVAETELVSLGRWVPPTTLLEATHQHDVTSRRLTVRVVDLNAGETLGTVTASGPPGAWSSLLKQVTVDFENLFRQAPQECSA